MTKKLQASRLIIILFCLTNAAWSAQVAAPAHTKTTTLVSTSSLAATNAVATNVPALGFTRLHPQDFKITVTRILQVPLFRAEEEASDCFPERMKSVARSISSLQPSYVSGLLRIGEQGPLRPFQVEAFQTLRKEVLAANPRCKFDVEVKAPKYPTAGELLAILQEINAKVAPDFVVIVIPKNNEVVYPSALEKGVEYLHAHGQMVGYKGPTSMIPDGIDFVVMRAENFEVRRDEIAALRAKHHLPVLLEVPALLKEDHHEVGLPSAEVSLQEQAKLLTNLAEEQNSFGYHFVYPILGCIPNKEATNNFLLVTMRALMARFN